MSDKVNLDQIRSDALGRIEQSERSFKLAFFAGAVLEVVFLAAFIFTADFTNRLHLLLLIATVGSYSVIVLGLVALGAHANRGTLRVLKAIELLKDQLRENKR